MDPGPKTLDDEVRKANSIKDFLVNELDVRHITVRRLSLRATRLAAVESVGDPVLPVPASGA